jgi:hypothetical protein
VPWQKGGISVVSNRLLLRTFATFVPPTLAAETAQKSNLATGYTSPNTRKDFRLLKKSKKSLQTAQSSGILSAATCFTSRRHASGDGDAT